MGGDDGAAATATPTGAEGSQGEGDGGSGLYDLSTIPPELRDQVEPAFKQFDANVTKKFQEHADFRRQWEPYEQLGLHDYEPDFLSNLLEFAELASDEDSYREWLQAQAKEFGIGAEPPNGSEPGNDGSPDAVRQTVAEEIQKAMSPINEKFSQQEQAQQLQQEREALTTRFDELKQEAGVEFSEKDEQRIWKLAQAFGSEDDPVGLAFKEYQEMIGDAEKGLLGKKLEAPRAPEGPGGSPATTVERPKTFADARGMAAERIKQSLQANA
jgi:hypothetical protein